MYSYRNVLGKSEAHLRFILTHTIVFIPYNKMMHRFYNVCNSGPYCTLMGGRKLPVISRFSHVKVKDQII